MSIPVDKIDSISLRGQGKVAVVVGGTLGVGAAAVRSLASKGCSKIIFVGRDESRAKALVDKVVKLSGGASEASSIKGELSTLNGIRVVVDKIKSAANGPIDYLEVMSQNGVPHKNGVVLNQDGNGTNFTVQVLSRFYITYALIQSKSLKDRAVVMSIGNTGLDLPDLDVNDINLQKRAPRDFWIQAKRDGTVLDSVFQEMVARYPQYRFISIMPYVIASEVYHYDHFPFPLNHILRLAVPFSPSPDTFIRGPMTLMLVPGAQDGLGTFFGENKLKPKEPGSWSRVSANRQAVWSKLVAIVDGAHRAP